MTIIDVFELMKKVQSLKLDNIFDYYSDDLKELGFVSNNPYMNICKYQITPKFTLIYYFHSKIFKLSNENNEDILITESLYDNNSVIADGYDSWVNILLHNNLGQTGVIISSKGVDEFAYSCTDDTSSFNINSFDESTHFQLSTIGNVPGIETFEKLKSYFQTLQSYSIDLGQEISFDLSYNLEDEL